jgi:hypothetical protein
MSSVTALALSPVNQTIALGGYGGRIDQWDPESQQPVSTLLQLSTFFPQSGTYEVSALAFSPDGTMLASSNPDGGVVVWHLASRQPLTEVRAEVNPVFFSLDSQMLIAGSQLIDLSLASWKQQACKVLNRNLSWSEWNLYLKDEEYRATCEGIPLAPSDLAAQADILGESGQIDRSKEILAKAVELARHRGRSVNEKICETGGFLGFGEFVLPACNRAVELCVPSGMCGTLRGQRAVARALAGDLDGAAEDLQAHVDDLRRRAPENFKKKIEAREAWMHKLKAGQNPFDAATRYDLRIE